MTGCRCSLTLLLALACLPSVGTARAADTPTRDSFDSNGVKISYLVQGKGEPVVLIHGWLSSAGINWTLPGTVALLAKDYQVIALDVRGHGMSDKPTKVEAYGPELVEDVVRLLDHLKIKKAHIVGYSMGGIIAAKFVARHPDRVLSAALCGAGWLREGSAEQKLFAAGGTDGKPVGLCFQSLAKLALTEEEVKSIRVPVVLVIGDKDELKKLYVDPLATVRKDWPVVEIKDANHISCILKPQFREEVAAWVKKNAR
jgi:pimeloyl-ACP methyl ester carboxylesterase